MLSYGLLCLALASYTCATPHRRGSFVVHEKRVDSPAWTSTRRLEGHVPIPLRVALKQQNLDKLSDFLMFVSDPTSASFGLHWSPEKVAEVFAPAPHAIDAVNTWLVDAGFDTKRLRPSHNKAWIEVQNATVKEAESLLGTEYYVYSHQATSKEHVACDSYSVPEHVQEHIDFITPAVQTVALTYIPGQRKPASDAVHEGSGVPPSKSVKRAVGDANTTTTIGCDKVTTPDCIRSLYNISYTPQATSNNSFGIVSHRANTYSQSDLDMFFTKFSPTLVGKSPTLVSIDGGTIEADNTTSFGEDNLVLEYAMAIAQPQTVTLLQVGEPATGDFDSFNLWLDAVDGSYCAFEGGDDLNFDPQFPNPQPGHFNDHSCGIIQPPHVISVSQIDEEHHLTPFYTQRQCHEYGKLGLMGVTVLYSSGDTGSAGVLGYCMDENGSINLNATTFIPSWPSSCPWITSVGGTQVKAGMSPTDPDPEEVWNEDLTLGFFLSAGGGFSNRFPTAYYQQSAVSGYLEALRKTHPDLLGHFHHHGRGYPDLSVNAHMFASFEDGVFGTDSGVSGSTPVVAAIITLINDARIAVGKGPVGFINPTIYSPGFSSAFNDIVTGNTTGCKGLQGVRDGGFIATPGWDAASGLGTPNFPVLLEKWLALP